MLELLNVVKTLEAMDTDVDTIMKFLATPETHFTLFDNMLKHEISRLHDANKPISVMVDKYDQYMNMLHDKWWGNTYPVHDSHFHKNFKEFCNCPFTCITEVVDCVNKVIRGNN